MIQFYAPDIEATGLLPEGESAHCCRVLRMKEGDIIYATDGKGFRFECQLVSSHPRHAAVEIISKTEIKPWWGFHLEICVAPSKNMDRIEWLVEKSVEIGVDRIVLMRCDRSERKWSKTERMQKIAVSAMKQSLKTYLPEITELTDFRPLVSDDFSGRRYIGYCDDIIPLKEFRNEYSGGDLRILIGPEGDFSPEEVAMAMERGYVPVTFGESRLRLETAALYAVTAAHVIGDKPSNI